MKSELRVVDQESSGVNYETGQAGPEARSVKGRAAFGQCPKCGKEYLLAIVREGEIRVEEKAFKCRDYDCGNESPTALPFKKEVEAFIQSTLQEQRQPTETIAA